MILQALHHHLNQNTPYKWEIRTHDNIIQTTITQNTHITAIITIKHDQTENTLRIEKITDTPTTTYRTTTTHHTIDLLDPEFLTKIHQAIEN